MSKITRAIELAYLPLTASFLALFLLKELGVFTLPVRYELLAGAVPILAIPCLIRKHGEEVDWQTSPTTTIVPFFAVLLALGTRLLPLSRSALPLGYDAGFYKYTMELYQNALPGIPETELATWVRQMYEQGLFVLSDAMHVLAGTSATDLITYLFPLLGAFLVLPLFIVARALFGNRVGILASFLYAFSYTQYAAFDLLYFKNVIGLILLLLAIYALEKKKDGLMALMFAALGIFHRPEFLLFALILAVYFVMHRRREIVLAVLGTAALIAPFWVPRWGLYWAAISGGIGGGTLFGFDTYTFVAMAYLPFAAIGAVYLAINKKLNSMLIYFAITCAIVVFHLFFFNRFIIMLDLAAVVLAAVGIERGLLRKGGSSMPAAVTIVLLVLAASALPTFARANDVRPRIDDQQLHAVEWIRDHAESNAYVLATSSDAPWVLGWSQRRVIAPGLFEWYIQSEDEWFTFFESKDPEVARRFVAAYDGPVYVYSTKESAEFMGLEKFQQDYFQQVYGDDRVAVYKYLGG